LLISIGGDDNIVIAKQTIEQVLAQEPRILFQPAPTIGVERITSTTVDLFVRPWVLTSHYAAVKSDLQERLKLALDKVGIAIPARPAPIYLQMPPKV
jgi:small conductance mechanosensitive channel